ncbi:FAD dependent oxidoreductase [Schizothecium vesticola]|uniref:L-2-hydroxyglutarate dehydrogenase, mitochondrial n=1 Tax=Schizothecium vesticola TaxID=314040 RepID=A0AA40EWJ2_9PEZI|nr:FAD dependent oxidoreductase [Schizothecium vesticola]
MRPRLPIPRPTRVPLPRPRPPARPFSSTTPRPADFTHAVIGGGVVGLAIARELAQRGGPSSSTVLLERHSAIGTETSSRNSEVIHAGIYYPPSSLKTALCIRGKDLLYDFCTQHHVPHRRCGKWIVAQTPAQHAALTRIHDLCATTLHVPTRWVSAAEASRREPAVRADAAILESPTTGIIDSHTLMLTLLGHFEDAGGTLALNSPVTAISPLGSPPVPGSAGWALTVDATPTTTITASTIINAAGLSSAAIHNMIVPPGPRRMRMYYAKGNYFSYSAPHPKVNTLVYPAPEPGGAGLGTHLTLDLAGRMRFGPDVEWVDTPGELGVSEGRVRATAAAVRAYLPGLDEGGLRPDYAGIRPKLAREGAVGGGKGFVDFVVREEEGYGGWVNLLGIESPGLTSCLAIAERVGGMVYGK